MWRIQTRLAGKVECFGFVLLFVAVMAAVVMVASAAIARTWTSKSGKYQIEADLVKSENGKVTLRKPGGDTITVDESQLSDDDRTYLRSAGGGSPEKVSGVEGAAK